MQDVKTHVMLTARHAILRGIREFFWSHKFLEIETPIALARPSQEPYLDPLRATIHDARGVAYDAFLRMSPEFSLKKVIASGVERCFEIGSVFRDGEPWDAQHNPEFTMMEWYRARATYGDLMSDCENLFVHLLKMSPTMGSWSYHGQPIDFALPWERLTMREAWQRYAQLDLDLLLTRDAMAAVCRDRGHVVAERDTFDDCFFRIHLTEIEPKLGRVRPTFLIDWPIQMAALAKRKDDDPRYAERVELYIGGLEIANGFSELTDAAEQRARFLEDQALRRALGKPAYPLDESFLEALAAMPPTAGIALGVDRLVMLLLDARTIDEVRFLSAPRLWRSNED